jgi:hypothetical protein
LNTNNWPSHLTQKQIQSLAALAPKVFLDKHKLACIRLENYKYPSTALWLPEYYQKEAICNYHDQLFAGHNATQKSYIKLTSSYFWPDVYYHFLKHKQTCLRCQGHKSSKLKPPPLTLIPVPEQPNVRIHADLFAPMMGAECKQTYILCITDAFSKYKVVTSIPNKEAETVARAIFENWFCKFGILA